MPEHTIPESLIDQIRSGRAVLVVGAGIGVPSWKQLLEKMTQELELRGREGDDAAARDLAKLLHKGSLVRAVGFLARSLGNEACDRIIADLWQTPELPPLARLVAELPFHHVWTTFPGDLLDRAMAADSPEGWPPPRVVTYRDLGELSARRRTLVKVLGDFDSYVVTPGSVRRALSRAVDLRDYARDRYVDGALVFVGFRFGDPDLAALLDRVFGAFEPPRGTHYLVGAGLGPVAVDELMAEHHIEVIGAGAAAGEVDRVGVEWLTALRDACRDAGLSLESTRPAADDLDGWLALYADELPEARDAVDLIERRAHEAGDSERLIEVLLARVDLAGEGADRVALLGRLAEAYEAAGDGRSALTALTTAWHVDPAGTEAVVAAERLAAARGDWSELVAEAAELATELTGPVASIWWGRMGRWYSERLDRADYATTSLQRALELDPGNRDAHGTLAELLRKQRKWTELADALRAHLAIERDDGLVIDLLVTLGDLLASELAAAPKAIEQAIEAYQRVLELDDENDGALAALERLYRGGERWANLARVLDRRAELCDAAGDGTRAAALRHELATLRADKLGDLEGAIARYEAALAVDASDRAALGALQDLYDKTGRTDDLLRTLERLAEIAPEAERLAALRTLAAALEDRPGAEPRAIDAYERVLVLDATAEDAYRGLARLYRSRGQLYDLVALYDRHVAATRDSEQRVELLLASAAVHEGDLADPHRAIEALTRALAIDETRASALAALARLYRRTEAWDRAVDALARHAALVADSAADAGAERARLLAEAGRLAFEAVGDADRAERLLEQALAADAEHAAALRALAEVHLGRGSHSLALEVLLRAEQASTARQERLELLVRAAELAAGPLGDDDRALELWERVLRLDPDHVAAGRVVADRLVAARRWDDALPVLEMLARHAEVGDRAERARRETQLGLAYAELHRTEKSVRHYRLATEADPDDVDAALGLAGALMVEAQARDAAADAAALWQDVERRYRDVLARHASGLADGQVADLWHRLGVAARAQGDDKKAESALRRALERDPLHAPTLQALVEIAGQRGDWRAVADAKRAQLERAPDALKVKLLEEIGDVLRTRLKDPGTAAGAYLEALELAPASHALLHKLLEAHTEQKQWRRAIDALDELAKLEASGERRARYQYAAGVIARDELGDADLAVERFGAALDAQPDTPKAFEAIDRVLSERGEWKALARQYRRLLKRIGDAALPERLLELWTRLGDICLDHLGDAEAAIAAFEVAADLAPDDLGRREQLAELYLDAGEPRRADAIEELQGLLAHGPDRVELYKALAQLYRAGNELDKAWCLAQALVFLGAATDDERALYERHRPDRFYPVSRRLTEELWQKAIMHPREDRHVGAILASSLAALAASSAQPPQAFGLQPAQRADLERDTRAATRLARYAVGVLALDPTPMVWLEAGGDGLRFANTLQPASGSERGRLVPSLLIGAPHLAKTDERELVFELGKRMAYLRPERYANVALPALATLEGAFYGVLRVAGADVGGEDARRQAQALEGQLAAPVREQVAALSAKISGRLGNGLVAGWRSAADLTANRVGLILCNDLEVAARTVATETAALSGLSVKDRLRDLLAYSVSEPYFQVRRHLGIHVREEAAA